MLIVCPNCTTSYMIDPASVGPAGRSVRCARCKSTWFAGTPKATSDVSSFVDGVIAEAEAQSAAPRQDPAPPQSQNFLAMESSAPAPDDFGNDPVDGHRPTAEPDTALPSFGDAHNNTDLVPRQNPAQGEFSRQDLAGEHANALAIADSPSLVPPRERDGFSPADGVSKDVENIEDTESFVARRQRLQNKRQKSKRRSRWAAIILVLFAFNVALIGARGEVVRYLPQTASLFAAVGLPVNLRNLKFENVKIVKETQDNVSILIIEGVIANTANKPTEVPRLRFAARNARGQDVYTWSARPSRGVLGPKESMEFNSRLAAPPADAIDVMVRFFSAQDASAGVSGQVK